MTLAVIRLRKVWYAVSGLLVATSLMLVAVLGIPFGIDFTGGSLLEVRFDVAPETAALRKELSNMGYAEATVQSAGTDEALIRLSNMTEEDHQRVLNALEASFGNIDELRFDSIGPTIGKELKRDAMLALAIALILIVAYVAWAFRKVSEPIASWKYGLLTIVAALHDLIIPLGVFAVLGASQNFQIDTAFIAALLTILGYSINDTIVVFDRTRENLARWGAHDFEMVVEKSVQQTFARSINTTLTTLLALLAVFLFGGETTRSFALALLIGIGVGAYSSVFIASPLLVTWYRVNHK
ncbi:TPA: protein translocase subunit SecF [Candidatus Uhrbacteria bacterium]|nr:MAG: protein-export membrane protein SecF [Candidatus Uhrbacteria bacterium RIFCSPHIGHO2_02_FULL_54_11]HBL39825.1 protein translocase subunit SecF [Candidatus Uhrbacteria bacterium]